MRIDECGLVNMAGWMQIDDECESTNAIW